MDINKMWAATPPDPNLTKPDTPTRPPARTAPRMPADDALAWCLDFHITKHGPFPLVGGRNKWVSDLAHLCNVKGVPQADFDAHAVSYMAPDFTEREIRQTVGGIYTREAAAHGSKPYTAPLPSGGNKESFSDDFRQKGNAPGAGPKDCTDWLPHLLATRARLQARSVETVTFAPPLFYQDEEPVIWPRTLALIQGQTGAHKSRVAELFSTVLIAEGLPACDTVGLSRHGAAGQSYTLCYVDTERNTSDQLPYALQQIRERAGYPRTAHPAAFDYISLEPIPRAERLDALAQYLRHVRTTYANHLLIVLDVLTDCIGSFNDEKESLLLVDMLNRLCNEHDVTFLCVIHENPGGVKARGHLGTEAANKASTVLQVGYVKQANGELSDVIELRYLKRRAGRPGLVFHVSYDEATAGLVRADPAAVADAAARRRTVAGGPEMAAALATELAFGPLNAGELERRLMERLGASARTVRERLTELLTTGAPVPDAGGREYRLTKDREGRETRYTLAPTEPPEAG